MEDGHDELFARDGEEEYAAKDGESFPEQFEVLGPLCTRVFKLIAEGGAQDVVGVVVKGQVLWVRD